MAERGMKRWRPFGIALNPLPLDLSVAKHLQRNI